MFSQLYLASARAHAELHRYDEYRGHWKDFQAKLMDAVKADTSHRTPENFGYMDTGPRFSGGRERVQRHARDITVTYNA